MPELTVHRLRRAEDTSFAACWELYEASFPPEERRTLPCHGAAMAGAGDFRCLCFHDAAGLAGIAFCWQAAAFLYVEHLAIVPERRGQGLGHRLLDYLAGRGLPLILEIEPVVDAATERRWHFYRSAGFHRLPFAHLQPIYRHGDSPLPLELLSFPHAMSATEVAAFEHYLHERVMCYTEPRMARK